MECDQLMGKTRPYEQFRLYNQSPLTIIELIANQTNFDAAIKLLQNYLEKRKDLFLIEERLDLQDQIELKWPYGKKISPNERFRCILCQNHILPEYPQIRGTNGTDSPWL